MLRRAIRELAAVAMLMMLIGWDGPPAAAQAKGSAESMAAARVNPGWTLPPRVFEQVNGPDRAR